MDLAAAALIFATKYMDSTWNTNWGAYDRQTMSAVVDGIVKTTQDVQLVEMLIKIARWESGGFRKDIATCKVLGKLGERGVFQVLPFSAQDKVESCSTDYAKQAATALGRVKISINTCKRLGFKGSNLITAYTHGTCQVPKDNLAVLHWSDGKALQSILDEAAKKEVAINQ